MLSKNISVHFCTLMSDYLFIPQKTKINDIRGMQSLSYLTEYLYYITMNMINNTKLIIFNRIYIPYVQKYDKHYLSNALSNTLYKYNT